MTPASSKGLNDKSSAPGNRATSGKAKSKGWIFIALAVVAIAFIVITKRPAVVPWQMDHDTAVALAKEQGKPIFIAFTSEQALNSRLMKQRVLTSKAIAEKLKAFVPIMIDGDENSKLVKQYDLAGLPCCIAMWPGQEKVYKTGTYVRTNKVLECMDSVLANPPSKATKQ